jgi:beta-phosphoglucomutase
MFLIFDVDGTMFRNVEFHFEAWQVLFLRHNVPFNDKVKVSLLGRTAREAILDHFGNELDAMQIAALVQEKEADYRELYHLHVKPIDGLVNLLDECAGANVRCAVASSGTRENIDFVLEQASIKKYFSAIVDGTEVVHGKPSPEIFALAAKRLGASPASCIVFEDANSGLCAAKLAGMMAVGITTYHSSNELSDADLCIDSFAEVNLSKLKKIVRE